MLLLLKRKKNVSPSPQLHSSSQQVCVNRPALEIYNLFEDFSARLGLGKDFLLTNKGAAARGPQGTQQPEMKKQTHPSLM